MVGCWVRDSRPSGTRGWPHARPVTPAIRIRPDTRHDQRACLAWRRGPMGDDLGPSGPGCVPYHHRGGIATGASVRSDGLRWRGRGDGHGGGIRSARPWELASSHRCRHSRVDSPRPVSAAASVVLLGLVTWFAADLHGGLRGLAERVAVGAEALWPLAVVITTRRAGSVDIGRPRPKAVRAGS